jgi:hypothetical protein
MNVCRAKPVARNRAGALVPATVPTSTVGASPSRASTIANTSSESAGRKGSSPKGAVAASAVNPVASRRPSITADPASERNLGRTLALPAPGTTSLTSTSIDSPSSSTIRRSRTCTTRCPPSGTSIIANPPTSTPSSIGPANPTSRPSEE